MTAARPVAPQTTNAVDRPHNPRHCEAFQSAAENARPDDTMREVQATARMLVRSGFRDCTCPVAPAAPTRRYVAVAVPVRR